MREIKESMNYTLEDTFDIEDIENRRLHLNYEIDETVIDDIAYHIMRYNKLDKDLPVEKRTPIIVYINSPGGSVSDGFGLIDVIMLSKTPVYTVNQGICYSMGYLIFLAGHKRYAMPNSTFLQHEGGSFFGYDSAGKLKDRMEFEAGEMESHVKEYVLERTKIAESTYVENSRREWYFYPIKAKELGVVDYIVGQDCDMDEIL